MDNMDNIDNIDNIKRVFNKNLINLRLLLNKYFSQFYVLPAPDRIAFYKLLHHENNMAIILRKSKRIFNNPNLSENKLLKICILSKNILLSIKEIPKGSSHHNHQFAQAYSADFFKYLLDEFIDKPENDVILLFIIKKNIEQELMSFIDTYKIFDDASLVLFPRSIFNKFFRHKPQYVSNILVVDKLRSDVTLNLINFEFNDQQKKWVMNIDCQLNRNNFLNKNIIHNLIPVDLLQKRINKTYLYVNIDNIFNVITINNTNKHIYHNIKLSWGHLEFSADRWKYVIANFRVLRYYYSYIGRIANNENISNVQLKDALNFWDWERNDNVHDYRYVKYELNNEFNINKIFNHLNDIFFNIKHIYNVIINIILGSGRPKTESEVKILIAKFRLIYNKMKKLKKEKLYPVIGFDVYLQEDVELLKYNQKNVLYDNTNSLKQLLLKFYKYPEINETIPSDKELLTFYFHAGETNFDNYLNHSISKKLYTFEESQAYNNLLMAAQIEGTLRVGHGLALGLKNFENLLNIYIKKNILVEVCPLSNYVLHFVNNMKDHPVNLFLKRNLHISINSDDRSLWNYEYSTYDWFDFVLGTDDIKLEDLICISLKSIYFSSNIEILKEELLELWKINFLKSLKILNKQNYFTPIELNFNNMLNLPQNFPNSLRNTHIFMEDFNNEYIIQRVNQRVNENINQLSLAEVPILKNNPIKRSFSNSCSAINNLHHSRELIEEITKKRLKNGIVAAYQTNKRCKENSNIVNKLKPRYLKNILKKIFSTYTNNTFSELHERNN